MRKMLRKYKRFVVKFKFYFMSLWLLFMLTFILTVDIPINCLEDGQFIGVISLIQKNVLAIIFFILAIFGWCLFFYEKYQWSGVSNPPYKIKKITNKNYEHLAFLTTYIIPLVCIDFTNSRYIIVFFLLLLIIGLIFIKMDLYFGNPTLALMGYRLYCAEIEDKDIPGEVILISADRLSENSSIKWVYIDENIWLAKEIKK